MFQFSAFTEPDLLLSALKSAQPDMILVDLNLNKEKENGIDVVSEIKRYLFSFILCRYVYRSRCQRGLATGLPLRYP